MEEQHEQPEGERPSSPEQGKTCRLHPAKADQETDSDDPPHGDSRLKETQVG